MIVVDRLLHAEAPRAAETFGRVDRVGRSTGASRLGDGDRDCSVLHAVR